MVNDTGTCACWFCSSHLLCPSLPRRMNCSLYRSVHLLHSSQTPAVCTSSSAPVPSLTPWQQKAATRHQNMTTDLMTLHIQVLRHYEIQMSVVINLWSNDSYLCSRTSCVLCVMSCWWLMCTGGSQILITVDISRSKDVFMVFHLKTITGPHQSYGVS